MTPALDATTLEPVRAALLARARRDADVAITDATARAEHRVAEAFADAERRLSEARARGEAEAASALADEEARVRQRTRTLLLEARRAVYEELRRRTHEEVQRLRSDPTYPRLRAAVESRSASRLGPAARSREAENGGCVVEAPGRRIDATLDALADWALESVATSEPGPTP
jgi:vacuolar-type H+-ATPase subunit E/Vma4